MPINVPRRVCVRSFAKVNLDLRVLYRRPDGYHEIRSLFHTISLADRIEMEFLPGRQSRVSTSCPGFDIPEEQNLAHRAALAFLDRAKVRGTLSLSISKRIPLGGGLGGGSSNAASVLLALSALTGKALGFAELLDLAAALGSDLPFFLTGGAAVALGRGEELYPAPDLPALHGVLVTPGIAVSTPDAYRSLARTTESTASVRIVREFSSQIAALSTPLPRSSSGKSSVPIWPPGLGVNDFEGPVFRAHPLLRTWKRRLRESGSLHAMMSGSGSSLFGLYRSQSEARKALAGLPTEAARAFRLLPRSQYRNAWHQDLHPYSNHLWPPHPRID